MHHLFFFTWFSFQTAFYNYFLFCNSQYEKYAEVKDGAVYMVDKKKDMDAERQHLEKKIEELRLSKLKDEKRVEKIMAENAAAEKDLANLLQVSQTQVFNCCNRLIFALLADRRVLR